MEAASRNIPDCLDIDVVWILQLLSLKNIFDRWKMGIEMSSEKESQSLRSDSQSLCSVIAPMPWM